MDIDADMWALQIAIMRSPTSAPVISGTGELRKGRFSSPRLHQGKRGAIRICYAYFPRHWTILLIMAYGKAEKATLTASEKQGIRRYLNEVEQWLDRRVPPNK